MIGAADSGATAGLYISIETHSQGCVRRGGLALGYYRLLPAGGFAVAGPHGGLTTTICRAKGHSGDCAVLFPSPIPCFLFTSWCGESEIRRSTAEDPL